MKNTIEQKNFEQKEMRDEIRKVLNKNAEIEWKYIEKSELDPEKQEASKRYENLENKYSNTKVHKIKSEIYNNINPEDKGLLMNDLYFGLHRINAEHDSKRYDQARELIKNIAEIIGQE